MFTDETKIELGSYTNDLIRLSPKTREKLKEGKEDGRRSGNCPDVRTSGQDPDVRTRTKRLSGRPDTSEIQN